MRNPYKDEQYRRMPGCLNYAGADQDDRDAVTLFQVIRELDANGHFTDLQEDLTRQLEDLFGKAPEKDGIKSLAGGYLKYRHQGLIESGDRVMIPASPFDCDNSTRKEPDSPKDILDLVRRTANTNWWATITPMPSTSSSTFWTRRRRHAPTTG